MLALEGGYDLPAICDSAQLCVKALLGEPITSMPEEELLRTPNAPAVDTLLRTIAIQTPHWPTLKRCVPLVTCSAVEAATCMEGKILLRERVESETVTAMAGLSMHHARRSSEATARSNDSESSDASTSTSKVGIRRSSDMNMNEDNTTEQQQGDNEEPMDQDDELAK